MRYLKPLYWVCSYQPEAHLRHLICCWRVLLTLCLKLGEQGEASSITWLVRLVCPTMNLNSRGHWIAPARVALRPAKWTVAIRLIRIIRTIDVSFFYTVRFLNPGFLSLSVACYYNLISIHVFYWALQESIKYRYFARFGQPESHSSRVPCLSWSTWGSGFRKILFSGHFISAKLLAALWIWL